MQCTHLADGKLVRLAGHLGEPELPALRLALLMPMADECRDLVIDAGDIESIDDSAVAILIAAREWADSHGVRLRLSRSSLTFDLALVELDLVDLLPRLAALGTSDPQPATVELLPGQRACVD